MAETVFLKTGQFSSRSFNTSKSDLKRAFDALYSLEYYGALWNATYTCNGVSQRIFTAAMIEEATSLAILVEKLRGKLEAYSKLLQSGPDALKDADAGFKGEYTNAWQRTWYSISSGVSSVYETTVGFWGSLFHKDGKKTGGKTVITPDENTSNKTLKDTDEEKQKNGAAVIVNDNPDYRHRRWAEHIIPPKQNDENNRRAEAYREVMDALDVENNPRYDNTKGPTYCNIYVWDVTYAMGCEIPHWVNGRELNANEANEWLAKEGASHGWHEIDEATALQMANEGKPTVACSDGHIAMVSPSEPGDKEEYGSNLYLSQAGGIYKHYNGNNRHIPAGYVNWGMTVKYYYHD